MESFSRGGKGDNAADATNAPALSKYKGYTLLPQTDYYLISDERDPYGERNTPFLNWALSRSTPSSPQANTRVRVSRRRWSVTGSRWLLLVDEWHCLREASDARYGSSRRGALGRPEALKPELHDKEAPGMQDLARGLSTVVMAHWSASSPNTSLSIHAVLQTLHSGAIERCLHCAQMDRAQLQQPPHSVAEWWGNQTVNCAHPPEALPER
ncbi:hypothetical protein B0H17DRAFT_1150661 [Mycena rosella]|uniref:Uncharacterized protein n=1 Tax=Mycena rosella TaxID=1033263 RepID=A0AAD7BSF2_MYCRO|nr:hypothetical protein B0H17DRAFT_1150661 [Mycena rosella]